MTKERDEAGALGDDAKSLLRAAQESGWDEPPAGAKERVRTALAIALAGTATAAAGSALGAGTAKAAAAASAASTSATTAIGTASAGTAAAAGAGAGSVAAAGMFSGLAAKVAIAAIAVSAVGGTIALTRPPADAPRPAHVAVAVDDDETSRPARRETEVEPAAETVAPMPAIEPAGETITETVEVAPAAEAVRAPRVERAVASAVVEAEADEELAPASTLEDENAVLDRLHVAQGRGDADAVLGIIAEHRARFPRGRLSEEFSAAEVRTLCRAHDPRAPELRAAFEERYPRSLFLTSIASACP